MNTYRISQRDEVLIIDAKKISIGDQQISFHQSLQNIDRVPILDDGYKLEQLSDDGWMVLKSGAYSCESLPNK